jgi:hypothetical protein
MDARLKATTAACLAAAHDRSLDLPTIVGRPQDAGFDGYLVDDRRGVSTCYGSASDSTEVPHPVHDGPVAAAFGSAAVRAAVQEAQARVPGYAYAGFCRQVTAAGCAGDMVSLRGRRIVHFGRTAETHVRHVPP